MQRIVLLLMFFAFASCAFGQAARFAGQYVGVAAPSKRAPQGCGERVLADLTVHANGAATLVMRSFDGNPIQGANGVVNDKGRAEFNLGGGTMVSVRVSPAGVARGVIRSDVPGCRYTFAGLRRYPDPYEP